MQHLRRPLAHAAVALIVIGWPAALVTLTPFTVIIVMVTGAVLGVPLALTDTPQSAPAPRARTQAPRPPASPAQQRSDSMVGLTTCLVSGATLVGFAGSLQIFGWWTGLAALTLISVESKVWRLRHVEPNARPVSALSNRAFAVTDTITPHDLMLAWKSSERALTHADSVAERLRLVRARALYLNLLLVEEPDTFRASDDPS